MKRILIIAGPNGAGKTSFANEYLPEEGACSEFINADLIAAGLSPFRPERAAFLAGRLMLARLRELGEGGESFAFETTLSSRSYAPHLLRWQRAGYRIRLYFLKLPSANMAVERVAQRVRQGGHDIPEAVIRRRFDRGLINLEKTYLSLVDEWFIYDSSGGGFELIDSSGGDTQVFMKEDPRTYGTELSAEASAETTAEPLYDPDFSGALAALRRAAVKAVAKARAAGLEPVVIDRPGGGRWSTGSRVSADRDD